MTVVLGTLMLSGVEAAYVGKAIHMLSYVLNHGITDL